MRTTHPPVPLNLFGIPFGLLGLADCWLAAAGFGLAPVALGRALVAIAVLVWLVVGTARLRAAWPLRTPSGPGITDPVAGPFASLAVITPMLAAAAGLYPLSHGAGTVVVDVLIAVTVILGGWFTGQWIYRPVPLAAMHPGYFLPTVAGGFVASASAALVGQVRMAEILFGLGLVCWIVLGSIVLGRLVLGPPLAPALVPTLAIEVAPAAVATFALFVMNGHRVDLAVRLLAGYGLLMVLAQVRLVPAYVRLRFMPSLWAFTFSWASVVSAGVLWLGITHPAGWRTAAYALLVVISVAILALALRTGLALGRGQLLAPAGSPPLAAGPTVAAAVAAGPLAAVAGSPGGLAGSPGGLAGSPGGLAGSPGGAGGLTHPEPILLTREPSGVHCDAPSA